ncbi:aldehyde dehydrogenase family protein [Actinomadura scrupuli]|uniref:aldehyde dehydrogenase family protein n=1 Tax=Actinomadura scrupuli TaxID=559629 RepID=UPI003D97A045
MTDILAQVAAAAGQARAAADQLAAADDTAVNAALLGMADLMRTAGPALLDANTADLAQGAETGMPAALLDRLRLDETRLRAMADQLRTLAGVPFPPARRTVRTLPGGHRVQEWRRPVGVIGANYEARPNVTVDVASQLIKSRNAGVLRTGAAALRSAEALLDHVVTPALSRAHLDPHAIALVRTPDREGAQALVSLPGLVPLVILRGSGESTCRLDRLAASHGVRTLAHADGGGVLYVDRDADLATALALIEEGLDRLGVCNRLNLLLICREVRDRMLPEIERHLEKLGITPALPPHDRPRGTEWALVAGEEATVTVDVVADAAEAARVANEETSGLAATIVTEDPRTADAFMGAYRGTGVLWNATTRLIDGQRLLGVPETGINIGDAPGPRGPVTFMDLYVRQFAVLPPAGPEAGSLSP